MVNDGMAIYFPVLRWKLGERSALQNLAPAIKEQITPIIEFPFDCDYNDRKVTDFCITAVQDWGAGLPFYLDLSSVNFDGAPTGMSHPALVLFTTAHQQHLLPIPVINIDMHTDLLGAIHQAYTNNCFKNIALRITENDEDSFVTDVLEIIDTIGIRNTDIDLIIDLRDISKGAIQAKIRVLNVLVGQLGTSYRRTIVLSGAFPSELSNYVGTDDEELIPRHDWHLWIRAHRSPNLRHLLFGDYTTIPCEFREIPFQGAPKIKYTLENEWFVIKGHRSRRRDNQRQEQALVIVNKPFFRGAQHSFGETRIRQCADGNWGPGNPTNWVTNDINQHITFVVSQVSAILAAP